MAPVTLSPADAAARVEVRDTLGVPLGPGQPAEFLHALGEREDWIDLTVFGALLVDLYTVFTRPGVRYLSGFYGPAERVLGNRRYPRDLPAARHHSFLLRSRKTRNCSLNLSTTAWTSSTAALFFLACMTLNSCLRPSSISGLASSDCSSSSRQAL